MKPNIIKLILTLLLFAGIVVNYTPERGFRLSAGTEAWGKEDDDDWRDEKDWWELGYDSPSAYYLDIEGSYGWGGQDNPFTGGNESSESSGSGGGNGYCLGCQEITVYGGKTIMVGIGVYFPSSGYENRGMPDNPDAYEAYADWQNNLDKEEREELIREALEELNAAQNEVEDDGGGGNNPSNTDTPTLEIPPAPPAAPEVEKDCTEANQEVKQVKENLFDNPKVKPMLDELGARAKTNDFESASRVDYYFNKMQSGLNPYELPSPMLIEGNISRVRITVNSHTVLTPHHHTIGGFFPTSIGDLATAMYFADWIDKEQAEYMRTLSVADRATYLADPNRSFKGVLAVAPNGDEFLLYPQDLTEMRSFISLYGTDFADRKTGSFKKGDENEKLVELRDEFDRAYEQFHNDGFLKNEAYNFALAYLLESCHTGIKLMKKEDWSDDFEEQSVRTNENNQLIPTIKTCP